MDYVLRQRVNVLEKTIHMLLCKIKNNSEGGLETDPVFTASPAFNITDTDIEKWNEPSESTDTLNDVVLRGNYSSKPITFLTGGIEAIGQLGVNPTTFSYFWGDMNPFHTGTYNHSFGYGALQKVTTGSNNVAMGTFGLKELTTARSNNSLGVTAGQNVTTGNYNVFVGDSTANKLTTGYKNTYLGTFAGFNSVSSALNTFIGYKAGNILATGDRNIFIGAFSGQNVSGTNNILIGNVSGNNDGALTNKLIIHSNTTLAGYGNLGTQEGTSSNATQANISNGLITGDFQDRWVKFNGGFIINPSYMPNAQGDSTYNRNIVAKSDGTIGWENKTSLLLPYVPKVTLKSFSQDVDNYYIRVMVSGIIGGYSSPPFRIFVHSGVGTEIEANTIGVSITSVGGVLLPVSGAANSIYFTLTFPKSSNVHPLWANTTSMNLMLTAEFIGAHNTDVGSGIVYSVPRVGIDTQLKQSITI